MQMNYYAGPRDQEAHTEFGVSNLSRMGCRYSFRVGNFPDPDPNLKRLLTQNFRTSQYADSAEIGLMEYGTLF